MDKKPQIEIKQDDLYSRQIGTYGKETMGKLVQMRVLIHGLRGLGCEVAKNMILAGPKEVALHDTAVTTLSDLGANFYLSEADVGKRTRAEGSIQKLTELNPYVKVHSLQGEVVDLINHIANYDVICITEVIPEPLAEKIDEECRKHNKGFIWTAATGISGFCFVDYGPNFLLSDNNGEECKQYIVRSITNSNPGVVLIDDNLGGKLAFADGDFVSFKEVQGMNEINTPHPPVEIKWISPMAFSICDTSNMGEYIGGGLVEQVKVPKVHPFESLSTCLEKPYYQNRVPDPIDFSKFGRPELLHISFRSLFRYHQSHGALPELNDLNACKEIVDIARDEHAKGKADTNSWIQNCQDFDENVVLNVARWARAQISPVCAFLGGVVAQEIVKYTGKYTPISQWLWFDFFETVGKLGNPDRTPLGTRYDDQVAIYGREIQQKLFDLNVFMIGAGALGCEFLKDFALMGIATQKGLVVVTDNDNIEVSNLNRQFLFRKDDVHTPKSKTAARVIMEMNKQFKCKDMQNYVAPETENLFDADFWNAQDFVINAVDNVKARKYIDTRCTWFNKVLIDSGTLGTKAHVQLVVPNTTSCYNDTQDPPEDSIPMCTLHNFPAMIEHCIEWGRDHFSGYFTGVIKDAQQLLENPQAYFIELKKEGNSTLQLEKLNLIKNIVEVKKSGRFEDCVRIGFSSFVENFDHKIRQLLHNFPADYTNPDGSKFWSGSKRVPNVITFDINDEFHINFVLSYSHILAEALGIPRPNENEEVDLVKKITSGIPIPEFRAKRVYIKVSETDTGDSNTIQDIGKEEEEQISILMNELSLCDKKTIDPKTFKPTEFEKDDDSNHHIDFIHAASNLRARNYRISECDRHKSKMIAGKIIPAIATTTAAITGIVCLQMFTLLQTREIESLRGAFINLAVSLFVLTEPEVPIKHKDKAYDNFLLGPVRAIPKDWTVWDKLVINGSMTFQQLLDHFMKEYEVDVQIVTVNGINLLQTFQPSAKNKMNRKIEDVYVEMSKTEIPSTVKYLIVEVAGDIGDAAAVMPNCQYNFR